MDELNNRVQHLELVEQLVDFVVNQDFDSLPAAAVEAAEIFLMDTIAVGIAGTTYDATDKALKAAQSWGENGNVRVVGRPEIKLSRTSAAFVNGIQTHALEWDGLHEPSVVIALCAPVSAMMAEIDTQKISGKALITALVIAVEVAVFFGGDSTASPRFFRPSAAGVMGATMAMAHLRKFDKNQTMHALGLAYSQTSGTMQAHWEGSMALPMQIGVAARTAHMSVDMVAAGMTGPVDIIGGRFGYFQLFETGGDVQSLLNALGKPYKMTEMAHKPYPAGRATQATLTMIRDIQQEHSFSVADIKQIDIYIPPLVLLLVGRPPNADMTPSYARLCLRFVAPLLLIDGDIDPRRYSAEAFTDEAIVELGKKINLLHDGNPDKNALGPQRMELLLTNGTVLHASCTDPLGSPENPLSKVQREDKVKRCFSLGLPNMDADSYIQTCQQLANLNDCSVLLDHVSGL
ncbi:MmgE/PrpD family protein [Paraglaciecola sp. 2405UD69-4]|uniref:MmgE/PrpD family protein n=1 Tax=Paraglaciecola sp. 2405UD69-4 TaxID=3391836 RepID=UPI0039C967FF